jgi:hypothetical protein
MHPAGGIHLHRPKHQTLEAIPHNKKEKERQFEKMVKYSKSEFSNQVSQAVILELLDV